MPRKLIIVTAIVMVLVFTLTACQKTDVIGKYSKTSFEALLSKLGHNVKADKPTKSWYLTSPGGERFIWGKGAAGVYIAAIEFDAAPFINAGLDTTKLPADIYTYDQTNNKLIITRALANAKGAAEADTSAADSFTQIIDANRDAIGYHAKLDHYNIDLGNGNMFEWAKDMSKNDKDMVFVLNPKLLTDAGVDPTKVTGWVFTKVEVMDQNNKPIQVDKFLKPYDISK